MLANALFHSLEAEGLLSNGKGIEGELGCGSFSPQDDLCFCQLFYIELKNKRCFLFELNAGRYEATKRKKWQTESEFCEA